MLFLQQGLTEMHIRYLQKKQKISLIVDTVSFQGVSWVFVEWWAIKNIILFCVSKFKFFSVKRDFYNLKRNRAYNSILDQAFET